MRVAWVILGCLALVACVPASDPGESASVPATAESVAPSPTGSASPTPSAVPSVRDLPLGTLSVEAAGISVEPAAGVELTAHEQGAIQLTARLPASEGPTRLELVVEPGTLEVVVNGGVALIAPPSQETLGAVPQPQPVDGEGQPVVAQMAAIDASLQFAVSPEERHVGEIVIDIWVGRQLIEGVSVGIEREQPRYSIMRTPFGHAMLGEGLGSPGAREFFERVGWRQAVALEPALSSPETLKHQFDCHVLGAPRKQSWNLEAFRPDHPGWTRGALEHRCNWEEGDLLPSLEESMSPSPSASPSE